MGMAVCFEQVINLPYSKNSFRRKWMSEHLFGLFLHVTSTPRWILRPVKVPTSSELYLNCFKLPTSCSGT